MKSKFWLLYGRTTILFTHIDDIIHYIRISGVARSYRIIEQRKGKRVWNRYFKCRFDGKIITFY